MVLHNMSGDGGSAVGCFVTDSALVGALVPFVVFDGTDTVILADGGQTLQLNLIIRDNASRLFSWGLHIYNKQGCLELIWC